MTSLPPGEGTVKALTAQRFLDAKPQLQTGGKLTGSRKIRIRISCDISITMIHTDLRGLFKLSSLRLFNFAKTQDGHSTVNCPDWLGLLDLAGSKLEHAWVSCAQVTH